MLRFILYFVLFYILFRLFKIIIVRWLGNRSAGEVPGGAKKKSRYNNIEEAKFTEIKPDDKK